MGKGLKEKVVAGVEMTDLPTFSYTSTSETPTLYIYQKRSLPCGTLQGVPPLEDKTRSNKTLLHGSFDIFGTGSVDL